MKNRSAIQLIAVLVFGLFIMSPISAQKRVERAHKAYEQLQFMEAQALYLKAIEKGEATTQVYKNLGNTYYFNAQYHEAAKWYKRYFDKNQDGEAIELLRYAQALKVSGKDTEAEEYYEAFTKKDALSSGSKSLQRSKSMLKANADRYEIKAVEPLYDENQISFGHEVHDGKLIYASTHGKGRGGSSDAWDNMSFLSLFEVPINEENEVIGSARKQSRLKRMMKGLHVSSAVVTEDGNTIYFTGNNNTRKGRKGKDLNLKIYRSQKSSGGSWSKPEDLSINGSDFSTAHPALSPDETQLYFASDRQGGYGESDIYVVDIDLFGKLGTPKNLGKEINTPGRESFPFVSEDEYLYFSSDGHLGLGGLDVYVAKIHEDGSFGEAFNLGEPINSYADDFSFGINPATKYGFVSSDRDARGDSPEKSPPKLVRTNIYTFKEIKPLVVDLKAIIEGYVTDRETDDAVAKAMIRLLGENKELIDSLETNDEGYYTVEVERSKPYMVSAEKDGYESREEKSVEVKNDKERVDLALTPITEKPETEVPTVITPEGEVDLTPGTDLAQALDIPMIYFDFDDSEIRHPDAVRDLDKVYEFMEQYPTVRIHIRSHTDSHGSLEYNDALSERRAESTKNWLINRGIDPARLEAEGVGERELLNGCTDGVWCSIEDHQRNRRSEFIVIGDTGMNYNDAADGDYYKQDDAEDYDYDQAEEVYDSENDLAPGTDLTSVIGLGPIHFAFDDSEIRSAEAIDELGKVIDFMLSHPNVRIKIRSHTDSRGSMEYNDALSDRRAQATRNWLIDQGIDASRLEAEGLGERELLNECGSGVWCSPERHRENRRSEFIIIN